MDGGTKLERSNSTSSHFRLLQLMPIEAKDELDERCERCYGFVQNLIAGASEAEAHDTLNATVCKSPQAHEEVCLGLLISILTEPENAPRHYRDLTYVNRDGMALVIRDLNLLILERYTKFHDVARQQLIWLLREVLRNAIVGSDSLIYNLLRQIAGGDVSPKNVWLAEQMLDLLSENRSWLERHAILLPTTVYTFLRLIVDHYGPLYASLRQKEIDFCITLLRERFADCLVIGRDLVRLLQDVARLPEFEALWRDILHNPTSLSPSFTGLFSLLQMRTSRRFLQSRLTPDMERKINFLTSQVKFGQQKRFQEWFQRQYLSTPESQSLRCDLIRFICCIIHPSNEVLCSEIIPRWAVIGWILSSCTSSVAGSNAKLALFYDWLFFDPERDNIMNIEPAILVMHYSLRTHPVITVTLLDFLCRITRHFSTTLAPQVRKGVCSALSFLLEKRVIQSYAALFDSPKIDRELRLLIRECFPEFCSSNTDMSASTVTTSNALANQTLADFPIEMNGNTGAPLAECPNGAHLAPIPDETFETRFSDDECEVLEPVDNSIPVSNSTKAVSLTIKPNCAQNVPTIDLSQIEADFPTTIRKLLHAVQSESQAKVRCDLVSKLLSNFWSQKQTNNKEITSEQMDRFAQAISIVLQDEFSKRIQPDCSFNSKSHSTNVNTPAFVIICDLLQSGDNAQLSLSLCSNLCSYVPLFGCLILYLAKISTNQSSRLDFESQIDLSDSNNTTATTNNNSSTDANSDEHHFWIAYKNLSSVRSKSLSEALIYDLNQCQLDNIELFGFLISEIFRKFQSACLDNVDLLHLIVSTIDSRQLQLLVYDIIQGKLQLFTEDSISDVLSSTLEWETFEQFCIWQLVTAHSFEIELLLPLLSKIDPNVHTEAALQMLLLLKDEQPTGDLLKAITSADVINAEYYTQTLFTHWTVGHDDLLADLISTQLSKGTPNKKRRVAAGSKAALAAAASGSLAPSNIQLLTHLDAWKKSASTSAIDFFSRSVVQSSLANTLAICNENQKSMFNDLFNSTEDDDEEPISGRAKTNNNSKSTSSTNSSNVNHNSINSSTNNNTTGNATLNKGRSKNKGSTEDLSNADSDGTPNEQPPKTKKKKL